jgi:NitT/TauT family transport system permease protein
MPEDALSRPAFRAPPPMGRQLVRQLRRHSNILLAVVGALLLLSLWVVSIDAFAIPPYILPAPGDVWIALRSGIFVSMDDPMGYYLPMWSTMSNAIAGFTIATVFGVVVGAALAEFVLFERLLMPYFFAMQAIPKIAIAPLIVIWFGFGDGSKIALSALLAFFPVMVNVFAGCRAVNVEQIDLMRSLSATRLQTFINVKFPSAASYAFAGIDMAIVYALLGTIVAEFLGAQQGMGVIITKAQSVTDVAGVFAALVILAVTGILLHLIVHKLQTRLVHWNRPRGE